ncbi:MAG: NnrU family protein [Caldimonas sp.]
MLVLLAGLVLFLGVHSVSIAALSWRNETAARLGHMRWQALYSVVAALGIVLIVVGYGIARRSPVVLYTPPVALRHVALLLMLPVFPLFFATYLPGRIRSAAKHPTLLATKLWAVAHLLANGTLADVLLFGGFLVWAVVDRISVKRRPAAQTRRVPAASPRPANDAIALVGGLAVYALLLFGGHRWLTGMPLLAG